MSKLHHMRHALAALPCALILAVAGSLPAAATASTPVSGPSSTGNSAWLNVAAVTPYALCRSVGYDVKPFVAQGEKNAHSLTGSAQQTFDMRIAVTNPAGNVTDVEIVSQGVRSGEQPATAPRSFVLCAGPGWYTAGVTAWWCPGARTAKGSSPDCMNIAFSKRFLLKATNNRVTLTKHGDNSRVRGSKALFVVLATTRHRDISQKLRGVRVAIQRKAGSQWRTVKAGTTDSRGRFSAKVTYRHAGKQIFRAALGSSSSVTSATSKTRTVRVSTPRPKKAPSTSSGSNHPSGSSSSSSGGGSSSSYNGPRCYGPGGLTWRPC